MAANMNWAVHNGGQYSGSDEEEDVSFEDVSDDRNAYPPGHQDTDI